MAKVATAYADNQGKLHATPELAALADLTTVLGRIGAEGGITEGLAKRLMERRLDIEQVFADLDEMMGDCVAIARSAADEMVEQP